MSDDLDLRGIEHRHEPNPQFRAALQRRLAAIVAGTDPGSVTEARNLAVIDLEPTTAKFAPNRNRRRAVAAAAAAAAAAAIAVVAIRDDDATPADQPSPTETVPPTTPPRPLRDTAGALMPGTYFVDEVEGTPVPQIYLTVGSGWQGDNGGIFKTGESGGPGDGAGAITFIRPGSVFLDACHWSDGYHPGPETTLNGLVTALTEQEGWADVTVSDIVVDGYVGKAFQRTTPSISDCDPSDGLSYGPRIRPPDFGADSDVPVFRGWLNADGGVFGSVYGPGEVETLWVLDLGGTIVAIQSKLFPSSSTWDVALEGPSAEARAEFGAVLDSIRIERVSPTATVGPTTPPRSVGNPLVDIGSRLADQGDVELFRMNSDTERYWRLTTLPEFDGRTFRLPSRDLDRVDSAGNDEPQGRSIRQQIQIVNLTDKMVPAAADVVQVAPNADMRLNQDTGTLLKLTDLVPGEQFTIVSVEPDITVDELRAATTDNPPDEIFLGLPDDVPDTVSDTAAEVTAGAPTDYDRLIALQNWFHDNFEYSTEVQSGHGNNALENFLQIRKGYCEQFAATFAVMARTLGIPSRVAVGYTQGRLRSDGWYSVLGRNSHAWPEIWFDGIGWVDFEPTPQRGIPGAEVYTGVPAAQDETVPDLGTPEPGAATLPPTPTTVFSPPTAQTPAP